jgi:hypothetical protein
VEIYKNKLLNTRQLEKENFIVNSKFANMEKELNLKEADKNAIKSKYEQILNNPVNTSIQDEKIYEYNILIMNLKQELADKDNIIKELRMRIMDYDKNKLGIRENKKSQDEDIEKYLNKSSDCINIQKLEKDEILDDDLNNNSNTNTQNLLVNKIKKLDKIILKQELEIKVLKQKVDSKLVLNELTSIFNNDDEFDKNHKYMIGNNKNETFKLVRIIIYSRKRIM